MVRVILSSVLDMYDSAVLNFGGSLGPHDSQSLTMVNGASTTLFHGTFGYDFGNVEGDITDFTLMNGAAVQAVFSDLHHDFGTLSRLAAMATGEEVFRRILRGDDIVHGSALDDSISGFRGADMIYGHGGNDLIYARDRNAASRLYGDYDEDTLIGGAGNDTLHASSADEQVGGSDSGYVQWHGDVLNGGTGADLLFGGTGADSLEGGAGNDTLNGGDGSDTVVFFGTAAARVQLELTTAQATGYGVDRLSGIENASGGSGNDSLVGSAADNTLYGNRGNDLLSGGGGGDALLGGAGNDTLNGGAGSDWLLGGAGNDVFNGGGGNSDSVGYDSTGNFRVNLSLTGPQDTWEGMDSFISIEDVYGGEGNDSLTGDGFANSLGGGHGNDTLAGGAGNDYLNGSSGNDSLDGGDGNDNLYGDAGNDTIAGGTGDDWIEGDGYLYGSDGQPVYDDWGDMIRDHNADRFVFGAGDGADTIEGFDDGLDRIAITSGAASFADITLSAGSGWGDSTVVHVGSATIELYDIAIDQITAADFVFV